MTQHILQYNFGIHGKHLQGYGEDLTLLIFLCLDLRLGSQCLDCSSGNDGLLQLILFYLMNVSPIYNISFLQIDANYVGIPPPLEVTICNLNDNIDKAFLSDMVRRLSM